MNPLTEFEILFVSIRDKVIHELKHVQGKFAHTLSQEENRLSKDENKLFQAQHSGKDLLQKAFLHKAIESHYKAAVANDRRTVNALAKTVESFARAIDLLRDMALPRDAKSFRKSLDAINRIANDLKIARNDLKEVKDRIDKAIHHIVKTTTQTKREETSEAAFIAAIRRKA
jgi:Na+/phosphate symporter